MALAFALVATVTFASGDSDDGAAMAAEKEYVTDPTTGKQVVKPEYGGTITAALLNFNVEHGDAFFGPTGAFNAGPAVERLGMADWAVDRSVNKLVVYFPEDVLIGHLAESWENPDPLTYVYKLRDNVFFHDKPPVNGRQLTADDVAANYDRRYGIGRFAGEEPAPFPFGTGGAPFAALESVTATDELTLVFKLSQPQPNAHTAGVLDDCLNRAYPPEIFDMLDDPHNVIGTGPYIMDEFVSGVSVTYDRNPNYWKDDEKYPGNRLPYADKLVQIMMSDEATRLAALRSGQIDISGETGVSRIKSIANAVQLRKDVPGIQLFPIALRSETSLAIKTDEPPLSDIRVRHALQMAIDLETINDNYFFGFGEWQPMGPNGPALIGLNNPFDTWSEELRKFYSYDPEGAERLLDEAGYPRGANGVRFQTSIMTNGTRGDVGYMELVAGYWKEIGVEAEIETPDHATFEARATAFDFDGMKDNWGIGADYANLNQLNNFRSGNYAAQNDPAFDAMWEEATAATGDEYRRLVKALDMYVIEEHTYLWGPRVATFNVAQEWIAGYDGEMGLGTCQWTQIYPRIWVDSQLKAELN